IHFVVYRNYDCRNYHEHVKDDFNPLPLPQIKREVLAGLKAHFFDLPKDGDDAVARWENIGSLSITLQQTLETIRYPGQLKLEAPYTAFYHGRSLLADHASGRSGILEPLHQDHLQSLLDYVLGFCADDYKAADVLFAMGLVDKQHFQKLFPPNEVLVDAKDPQPLAYSTIDCAQNHPLELLLTVWNWQYDGLFRQKNSLLTVTWPSYDGQIPISALPVYPLRYDTTGLKERLIERGQMFWECRKRKFVSYESSNSALELQTV
ncbi:hypothetical protein BU16DRAFT_446688, partial [Lophium mytilinum]